MHQKRFALALSAAVLGLGALVPQPARAAELEVSGWIPYWRTEAGTDAAEDHLDLFTELNPFGYTVRADGSLNDAMGLGQDEWEDLFEEAEDEDVRIVPTVMWSDTANIYATLADPARRAAHIKAIVAEVKKHDFDGIDIDYEAKSAETRPYYSAFLKELDSALGKKRLHCTVEARMPLAARYVGTPPANIEYANDLEVLDRECDRVRIMTYDQQTADVQLNAEARARGEVYAPVADTRWVKKVVEYMDDDIDRDKMVLGVPTYGYIYQVMPNTGGNGFGYIKIEAFNPAYATALAKEYKITPVRGRSGELSFSYVPKDQSPLLPTQADLAKLAPRGTASANLASAGALALVKDTKRQAPVRYLTWSDAGAIDQKLELAEDLGLEGVAIFKIDGGSDSKMWGVLEDYDIE